WSWRIAFSDRAVVNRAVLRRLGRSGFRPLRGASPMLAELAVVEAAALVNANGLIQSADHFPVIRQEIINGCERTGPEPCAAAVIVAQDHNTVAFRYRAHAPVPSD